MSLKLLRLPRLGASGCGAKHAAEHTGPSSQRSIIFQIPIERLNGELAGLAKGMALSYKKNHMHSVHHPTYTKTLS